MVWIRVREGESFEGAVRKFRKKVEKSGILREARRREYYEKPSVKKKRKAIAARKRMQKRSQGRR